MQTSALTSGLLANSVLLTILLHTIRDNLSLADEECLLLSLKARSQSKHLKQTLSYQAEPKCHQLDSDVGRSLSRIVLSQSIP